MEDAQLITADPEPDICGGRAPSPTSHQRYKKRLNAQSYCFSVATTTVAIFALATCCLLPLAAGSPIVDSSSSHKDKFTSYATANDAYPIYTSSTNPISSLISHLVKTLTSLRSKWQADKLRRGANAEVFWGWSAATPTHTQHDVATLHTLSRRALSTGEKVEAALIPILVLLSGLFAGLTLGYFSIDPTQLNVLAISGTEQQKAFAKRIIPIRKNGHLLLTTLLLANMIVNETLPEISNGPLGGGIQAVVVSTVLIVIFAEIIPQSVCSRYGLWVGAKAAPLVRVLIWALFIFAYPVAKCLELSLGAHHGIIYRRSELKELINLHVQGGEGGGDLDRDTVTMAQGALGLQDKTAKDVMTPIEDVFMLPVDAKLDYETLGEVVKSGHSRIPVFQEIDVPDISAGVAGKTRRVKKVMGCLLVKSCILLDPEDATPLSSIPINAMPSVPFDEPLTNMLNTFQEGRSHMAIISRRSRRPEEDAGSVMTSTAIGMRKRLLKKMREKVKGGSDSSSNSSASSDEENDVEKGGQRKSSSSAAAAGGGTASTVAGGLASRASLKPQEQILPADAQLDAGHVEKFFEGLEGAPLGIITLEDVLEALIGEEIADEYDFDEGSHEPLEASQYVPPEAMQAAKNAAANRLALASATPLPANADSGLGVVEQAATSSPSGTPPPNALAGSARKKISLPLPPLFAMRRSSSAPGRKRTMPAAASSTAAGTGTPLANLAFSPLERTESPEDVGQRSPSLDAARKPSPPAMTALPRESLVKPASDRGRRRTGAGGSALAGAGTGSAAPSPAPLPNPLSEALIIERARRGASMAGGAAGPGTPTGGATTPAGGPPVAVGYVGPGGAVSVIPIHRASTPKFESTEKKASGGGDVAPAGEVKPIVAPQPVKKTPRFKSVSAAPVVEQSEKDKENEKA